MTHLPNSLSVRSDATAPPGASPTLGVVVTVFPKLSETFVAQEIRHLEERGFVLEIAAIYPSGEKELQPIAARIRSHLFHAPTRIRGAPSFILANLRTMAHSPRAYLRTLGVALLNQFMFWKHSFACFVVAGWLVHRWKLAEGGVQHLHSHFLDRAGQVASYAAYMSGVTHSLSAHATDIYRMPAGLILDTVARAQVLVTCTDFNARYLREIGVPKAKIRVVHHGVDVRRFSVANKVVVAQGHTRLMSVGRLVPKKGYEGILRAVELLRDAGISIRYHIYGEGPLRKKLQRLCAARGLTRLVQFHGMVLQSEFVDSARKGGILLCGSRTTPNGDRDGIPNSVAEAMAMAIPVIATRTSGIPEIIEDGVTGLLVPPEDPEAMASAVRRLIEEPDLATSIGLTARRYVEAHFESRMCAQRLEEVLATFGGIGPSDAFITNSVEGAGHETAP